MVDCSRPTLEWTSKEKKCAKRSSKATRQNDKSGDVVVVQRTENEMLERLQREPKEVSNRT